MLSISRDTAPRGSSGSTESHVRLTRAFAVRGTESTGAAPRWGSRPFLTLRRQFYAAGSRLTVTSQSGACFVPGLMVNRCRGAFVGANKTVALDARVIAENARMRHDLATFGVKDELLVSLRTEPSMPVFSAIWRIGSSNARTMICCMRRCTASVAPCSQSCGADSPDRREHRHGRLSPQGHEQLVLDPERGQVVTHPCVLRDHASVERDGLVRADECAAAAIDHQSGHEASA